MGIFGRAWQSDIIFIIPLIYHHVMGNMLIKQWICEQATSCFPQNKAHSARVAHMHVVNPYDSLTCAEQHWKCTHQWIVVNAVALWTNKTKRLQFYLDKNLHMCIEQEHVFGSTNWCFGCLECLAPFAKYQNYHFFFHKPFPQTTSSAALNLFGTLAGHGFVQGWRG